MIEPTVAANAVNGSMYTYSYNTVVKLSVNLNASTIDPSTQPDLKYAWQYSSVTSLDWKDDDSISATSPTLVFNAIMRNAGLEETQAGIKIAGRNINNLRYTIMSVCKFWSSLRTPSKATANPSTCAQTGVSKPHACAVYGSFMLQKQSWVAVTDSTAHKAYNTIQPFKEKLAQPCTRWSPLLSSNTDTAGWSAQWVLSRRNALRPTQDTEDMRDTDWWPRKDLNRLRSRKKDEEDERA